MPLGTTRCRWIWSPCRNIAHGGAQDRCRERSSSRCLVRHPRPAARRLGDRSHVLRSWRPPLEQRRPRPNTGVRGKPPASITGQGEDELAASTDLVLRLREYGHADHIGRPRTASPSCEPARALVRRPHPASACSRRSTQGAAHTPAARRETSKHGPVRWPLKAVPSHWRTRLAGEQGEATRRVVSLLWRPRPSCWVSDAGTRTCGRPPGRV